MDETTSLSQENARHHRAFLDANADRTIRKNAHRIDATPLRQLWERCTEKSRWKEAVHLVNCSRWVVSFSTRQSSFDLWASLGQLENLLSDYRRLSPRFTFLQLAGEAGVAAQNEYRLTVTETDRLSALRDACRQMRPDLPDTLFDDNRAMDVRVTRAGPWGGETGELVVEALENHALAGGSSLWLVAHGESADGSLRVTLDAFEISRWAWAPDFLASRGADHSIYILDWTYLFERLIQDLDGTPEPDTTLRSFQRMIPRSHMGSNREIIDGLRSHSGLSSIVDQILGQERDSS